MSRLIEDHWKELVFAMLIGWMSWMSYILFNQQLHIQVLENGQLNIIPGAVEKSLGEIRTRMNEEQKERTELLMLAHDNGKDIKDILGRLAAKP